MLKGIFIRGATVACAYPALTWSTSQEIENQPKLFNNFQQYAHMDSLPVKANGEYDKSLAKMTDIAIISGTASAQLSKEICAILKKQPTTVEVTRFSDGEISVQINESIRGKNCFIIQSCAAPVNDNIMELFLTITAARRSGAASVTAVIPYFGYRHTRSRGMPLSSTYHSRFLWSASADMAKMLHTLGVDKVVSLDLQRPGQGHEACFFDSLTPVETISSNETFVNYVKENLNLESPVVIVAPNAEYIKKARKFQKKLKSSLNLESVDTAVFFSDGAANKDKNLEELLGGKVKGADVIIVDDIVDTAGDLSILCRRLKKEGARRVFVVASHGLFTSNSSQLIDLSPVEKVIVTNSITLPQKRSSKILQVSIAPLLAQVIYSESVTKDEVIDTLSDFDMQELAANVEDDEEIFEME